MHETTNTSELPDTEVTHLEPLAKELHETTATEELDATYSAGSVSLEAHQEHVPLKDSIQYHNDENTPTTHEQLGKQLSNVSLAFITPCVILRTNAGWMADRGHTWSCCT